MTFCCLEVVKPGQWNLFSLVVQCASSCLPEERFVTAYLNGEAQNEPQRDEIGGARWPFTSRATGPWKRHWPSTSSAAYGCCPRPLSGCSSARWSCAVGPCPRRKCWRRRCREACGSATSASATTLRASAWRSPCATAGCYDPAAQLDRRTTRLCSLDEMTPLGGRRSPGAHCGGGGQLPGAGD